MVAMGGRAGRKNWSGRAPDPTDPPEVASAEDTAFVVREHWEIALVDTGQSTSLP
jgi:hypothetical protein